ncbi:MAG: FixH family protein [Bryobacteraceae bacterium]
MGCRKPAESSPAILIEHEVAPWPARIGTATITLIMWDAKGRAVRNARIALEADMSHPGMRPEFGETREIAPGRYQGRVAFTMAGDWVVLMRVTLPGGQKLERQMDVNGVR